MIDPAKLRFIAYGAKDTFTFDHPVEFELVKSYDSPAQSLEAVFPCEQAMNTELMRLLLFHGEQRLFYGLVDETCLSHTDEGRRLKIAARSVGALLLDNEAVPKLYTNVYLREIISDHLSPYGFPTVIGVDNPFFSQYQIVKGTSEWEAFSNFCRSAARGTAYLNDEGDVICTVNPPRGKTLQISNRREDAIHYASLRVVNNRYAPVSKFLIRDNDGAYSYSYTNPEASTLNIQRIRCLIPGPEYSEGTEGGWLDGRLRVRRSMLGKLVITATCPGLLEAAFGDRVDLDDGYTTRSGLFVQQVRHRLGEGGYTTTLTLLDINYV
jgi:hypothetical protein